MSDRMTNQGVTRGTISFESFSARLRALVAHRGLKAEIDLKTLFGEGRLKALYGGAEPTLSEIIDITQILSVPLTAFDVFDGSGWPELEMAYAEMVYHSAEMSDEERAIMANEVIKMVRASANLSQEPGPPLPDSITALLQGGSS